MIVAALLFFEGVLCSLEFYSSSRPTHSATRSKLGLGRFGFFKFGSIRFGSVFKLEYPVSVFRFRFLHITAKSAMKAHAVGKTSKGSEAAYAFTPSTSRIDDQQFRPTTNVYNRL